MKEQEKKSTIKKIWYFVWESDSLASWIVNIILAFLLIYFIVYPGLGFIFQTTHPIVAVVSSSMEHDGNFDTWWNSQAVCSKDQCTQADWYDEVDITKQQFQEFPFKNGFNKGDIMILKGTSPEELELGDILVFQSYKPDPIIHRIVKIDNTTFHTKGDHNVDTIKANLMNEENILKEKTVGYQKYQRSSKAILRIPFLGWIKIWFVTHPIIFIIIITLIILIISEPDYIKKLFRRNH